MTLIEITKDKFDVELEIAYATANNFTGKALYKKPKCFLNETAAELLRESIRLADQLDLRIKIFDAFRPLEVQQALWDDTPDPEFISNPEDGAVPHCRGAAVDLNLLDSDGNELDMGTRFDEFDIKSHHGNTDISPEQQRNRHILMGIMTTAGWDFYRNEWWHYQLFEPRKYAALTDKEAESGML